MIDDDGAEAGEPTGGDWGAQGFRLRRVAVGGSAARDAAMRSRSTDAGSSVGSCGTSRPARAAASTARRTDSSLPRAAVAADSKLSMRENAQHVNNQG